MQLDLSRLSDVQRRAVETVKGPVLVLAGAGSGKTSVLTSRVAYLIREKGVDPRSILAITFTNKAASEMRERIAALVDCDVREMMIATFHSMCARFLRRDAGKIGYSSNFTIYDTDDCKTVVKQILRELDIDSKQLAPGYCLSCISGAKNSGAKSSPARYFEENCPAAAESLQEIYARYCRRLQAENAMDFDDLLFNMLRVLREDEQARSYYTHRYQYVLVDEYQDTNSVQYELVHILSEGSGNIFVVGDDDQSIYAWRGADIRNILEFEKDFPAAAVIKLEQNYRSHDKILGPANAVISKAAFRRGKTLWSARKDGPRPRVYTAPNEYGEATYIAGEIERLVTEEGRRYGDIAILYRMHTQARVLEEKLRTYGIPYQIYGGMSFYERREIRDMVAYLTIVDNRLADTALLRIINTPRRGIGSASLDKLTAFAAREGCSLIEALPRAGEFAGAAAGKFAAFYETYLAMCAAAEGQPLGEQLEAVYEASGYRELLHTADEGADSQTRIENVEELIAAAYAFARENEDASLADFLAGISLISDVDTTTEEGGVSMMTLHSAKGLEFDTVFLAGMEENIFPSRRAVAEDKIDEERRLCYVGITRAKQLLYLTGAASRNLYASISVNRPSRFLEDIPPEMLDIRTPPGTARAFAPPKETAGFRPLSFRPQVEFKPQVKADAATFMVGMQVEHKKFGRGEIRSISGEGNQRVAVIAFADGERKMFLAFAPLSIV